MHEAYAINPDNSSNLAGQPEVADVSENGFNEAEKQILEALEHSPSGYMALHDVGEARGTEAEREAIERACWSLWRKGLIDAYRSSRFGLRVAIALPGVDVSDLSFLYADGEGE
jgi:hypothetical protein